MTVEVISGTITIPHSSVNKLPLQHGRNGRKIQTTQARKERKGMEQKKKNVFARNNRSARDEPE